MSEHVHWLIQGVVALAGLLVALKTIVLPIRKLVKRFGALERHTNENWMRGLRSDVWNPALPLAEKVESGAMYVKYGGNGETAAKHRRNIAELERQVGGGDQEDRR